MRRHRQRRCKGLRCFTVQLRETEIDALVGNNLLRPQDRDNRGVVIEALYKFLDANLDADSMTRNGPSGGLAFQKISKIVGMLR